MPEQPEQHGIGSSHADVPKVDEEAVRVDSLSRDADVLARDATFNERPRDFSTKTRTCYNSSCVDYRRERPDWEDCACKKTSVKGSGDSRFG